MHGRGSDTAQRRDEKDEHGSHDIGGRPTGPKGDDGDDAITLVIISSAGSVFKNSSGTTVLTAHVYVGGEEVTGTALTALGAIKWYKDGGTSAVATGTTLSVSASAITDKAVYEARLEA